MVTMQNNRSTQIDDKYSNRRERLAGWNHYMIVDSFQLSKVLWAFSIVSSHVLIYNYWINFTYCWDDSCLSQFSILSNTLLISEWRKSLLPHQMLQVPSPKNLWSFSLKLYQPAPETEAQIGGRRKWGEQTRGSWSWYQNQKCRFWLYGQLTAPNSTFNHKKSLVIGEVLLSLRRRQRVICDCLRY